MITSRRCIVGLSLLRAAPYSLMFSKSVQVKIVSVNIYGDSVASLVGAGATIRVEPDAPT